MPQPRVDRADLRADLAEFRRVGGDGEVAQRREHIAAADGEAVDAGDDRLRHVADDRLELVDRQADDAAPVVLALMRALVAAGAERLVAGAGQHDGGDRLVVAARAGRP